MSNKSFSLIHFDFDIGTLQLIPTYHESYKICESCSKSVLKKDISIKKEQFKNIFLKILIPKIKPLQQFPTKNEIFIFIIQYFVSKNDYKSQDLDNMAKTILDILKGQFYESDGQVRVLLMLKKMTDNRIPQNYAYIAVKELVDDRDIDIIKAAGIERSVTYYQQSFKTS